MSVVCIDTQIIIWGLREYAEPSQTENIDRAKHLLRKLHDRGDKILVPSIVVAEVMAGVLDKDKNYYEKISKMIQKFRCPPFDNKAAMVYANIHHEKWNQVKNNKGNATRSELKADMMILAIAISNKCKTIYTEDIPLAKLSNGYITVSGLPVINEQPSLFE